MSSSLGRGLREHYGAADRNSSSELVLPIARRPAGRARVWAVRLDGRSWSGWRACKIARYVACAYRSEACLAWTAFDASTGRYSCWGGAGKPLSAGLDGLVGGWSAP